MTGEIVCPGEERMHLVAHVASDRAARGPLMLLEPVRDRSGLPRSTVRGRGSGSRRGDSGRLAFRETLFHGVSLPGCTTVAAVQDGRKMVDLSQACARNPRQHSRHEGMDGHIREASVLQVALHLRLGVGAPRAVLDRFVQSPQGGRERPVRSSCSVSPIRCISPPGTRAANAFATTRPISAGSYCGRLLAITTTSTPCGNAVSVKSPGSVLTRSAAPLAEDVLVGHDRDRWQIENDGLEPGKVLVATML